LCTTWHTHLRETSKRGYINLYNWITWNVYVYQTTNQHDEDIYFLLINLFGFQKSENHTHLYIMRKAILSSYHHHNLNPRLITSLLPHHLTHRINHHHQITSLSQWGNAIINFFVSSNPLSDTLKSFSVDVTVYATYFSLLFFRCIIRIITLITTNVIHTDIDTHTTTYLWCSTIYTRILRHLTHLRSIVLQEGLCGQSPTLWIDWSVDISDWITLLFFPHFSSTYTPDSSWHVTHDVLCHNPHLYPLQLEVLQLWEEVCPNLKLSNTLTQGLYLIYLLLIFSFPFSWFLGNKSNVLHTTTLHETMPTSGRRERLIGYNETGHYTTRTDRQQIDGDDPFFPFCFPS